MIRMLSWNVNGIRAAHRKGFRDWLDRDRPDILCLQETKASPDQLPKALTDIDGYHAYFSSAEKKGYSGVALYTREQPESVEHGLGIERFDAEGRVLIARYSGFSLYTIYFPNGKASEDRLRYKMDFYDAFLDHAETRRRKGESIVVCGDVNTAHTEDDLARPKENETVSGFLPEERAWIDSLLDHGYIDTFREFTVGPGHYSWWDYKSRARERNVGWRLDYFFISEDLKGVLKSGFIMNDVEGSDHCPVGIELKV